MTVRDFIFNHQSPRRLAVDAIDELHGHVADKEWRAPAHVPAQYEYIHDLFDTDEPVWMFFFDAGRYDIFDQLVWDYMDGRLERVYNGGFGYTGDWTTHHLVGDFGNRGLFSYVPLRGFGAAEYDGRKHFATAPDVQPDRTVDDRLAELGYLEFDEDRPAYEDRIGPHHINKAVRERADGLNGGVIRYIAPHPPFLGLEDLTSESTKTAKTRAALERGDLTHEELTEAYIDTYEMAFEYACELIPDLDGRVVITADHGTCLSCGQLFHGRRLDMHDHMTVVPWFEVDRLT